MTTKMFYDKDIDTTPLEIKKIAVIGYGAQGHAQANNLRDSGFDVIMGLRPGKSFDSAKKDGFEVYSAAEATAQADVVMMETPDELQAAVWEKEVEPNLKAGSYLGFSHGFNIVYGLIKPNADINVMIIAPKGPGNIERRQFVEGGGIPSLYGVHQDPTGDTAEVAKAYAKGIGSGRAGILETTFEEETTEDLFGEQAVLCGGLTQLIEAGFNTLVEAGYSPELAYFETSHEMKMIVDLIFEGGFEKMRHDCSNTCEYGEMLNGPRIITEESKQGMRDVLKDIQDGTYAKKWLAEYNSGLKDLEKMRTEYKSGLYEQTGKKVRAMMPWISDADKYSTAADTEQFSAAK
ncbi:MAG: ketol-acid reductoisomerase [Leuconostoc mesenteroides]